MNRTILDYNSNINLLPVSKEQNLHRILKDVWEEVAMEIKTRDRSQPRFTYDDIKSGLLILLSLLKKTMSKSFNWCFFNLSKFINNNSSLIYQHLKSL